VKHRRDLEDLFRFLSSQNIVLSAEQRQQLSHYLNLLEIWSAKQNLVSRNDQAHLVKRHFLPSVFINTCLPGDLWGYVMDLGSGAGFPGILIKILRPESRVVLLDSSRKKTLFLKEVCEQLNLGARVVCARCENYLGNDSDLYQIVIARAVAPIQILIELAWSGVADGGHLLTIKGPDYSDEINTLDKKGKKIKIIEPGEEWIKHAAYLNGKYVIDVEKTDDGE
jgi:16S rRNA (guanine527-N7)-methyltransferase